MASTTTSSSSSTQAATPATIARYQPDDLDVARNNEATNEFQAKTIELRSQRPQWITYYQGQMIDKADYTFINRFDSNNQLEREKILNNPSERIECIKTLMTILSKVSKEATLQYTVMIIDDLLQEDKMRVDLLHAYAKKYKENIYATFIKMLYLQDMYLTNACSRIITKLACWSSEQMGEKDLKDFIYWIRENLNERNVFKDTLCRCLQMLFRVDSYRVTFYKYDGVSTLVHYLEGTMNSTASKDQMQYQVTFCLWLLTFNEAIAEQIQSNNMVIPILADILNSTEKEKVKRIILATLKNLLTKPTSKEIIKANCLCMLQSKVKKLIELMQHSQIEDPEIVDDIHFLDTQLETLVMDVSTFDEYTLEITSQRLSWSPAHKSDKFWRENAQRLNENNFFLVRKLIDMLKLATSTQVTSQSLEIALNDIGEYVRYYSRGKNVIEQLEGKTIIMSMLSHEDTNVRHQALLCIQKLMVHHWEYLTKIDMGGDQQQQQPEQQADRGGKVVESKA